jgi:hypothetical protein
MPHPDMIPTILTRRTQFSLQCRKTHTIQQYQGHLAIQPCLLALAGLACAS